jgi:hypothetical protein
MQPAENPFQLYSPPVTSGTLRNVAGPSANPFASPVAATTSLNPWGESVPVSGGGFNILDTETPNGLAVHLKSPRLRRQYWQAQFSEEYRLLSELKTFQEPIHQFLNHHGFQAISVRLDGALQRHTTLQAMYQRLHADEEETLHPHEQRFLAFWARLHRLVWQVNTHLQSWQQGWVAHQASRMKPNGTAPGGTLSVAARRRLHRWLKRTMAGGQHTPLPTAVIQEIYHLKAYLL